MKNKFSDILRSLISFCTAGIMHLFWHWPTGRVKPFFFHFTSCPSSPLSSSSSSSLLSLIPFLNATAAAASSTANSRSAAAGTLEEYRRTQARLGRNEISRYILLLGSVTVSILTWSLASARTLLPRSPLAAGGRSSR